MDLLAPPVLSEDLTPFGHANDEYHPTCWNTAFVAVSWSLSWKFGDIFSLKILWVPRRFCNHRICL